MKGYPFDLKRALAGDALCNGLGSAVEFIGMTNSVSHGQKVVVAEGGDVWTYYEDGEFSFDKSPSALDLRMVTDGGPTLEQQMVQALKALVSVVPNLPVRQTSIEDTQLLNEGDNAMELARAVLAKVDANVGS